MKAPKAMKTTLAGLLVGLSILAGCSSGPADPPYFGDWSGSDPSKDSFATLEMKGDGTFSVGLSEPGDGVGGGDTHTGTYSIGSSNVNEITFTVKVQSSLHEQHPTEDAGLAGGTLKWSKDTGTGKETMAYSYRHMSGRSVSFKLEKSK